MPAGRGTKKLTFAVSALREHHDEVVADLAHEYGILPPYGGRMGSRTLCALICQLGPGSRLWVALHGNAGRSFADVVAAATLNQLRMMCWDGKGRRPDLIDLGQPKDGTVARKAYGKAVPTDRLVRYLGDHIVRGD